MSGGNLVVLGVEILLFWGCPGGHLTQTVLGVAEWKSSCFRSGVTGRKSPHFGGGRVEISSLLHLVM